VTLLAMLSLTLQLKRSANLVVHSSAYLQRSVLFNQVRMDCPTKKVSRQQYCATGKLLFSVFLFALYLGYPSMDKAATWLQRGMHI
jgi:hypothetical protein